MFEIKNTFSYPIQVFLTSILNYILNNKYFIYIKGILNYPFSKISLKSDIKNVVYFNWMIPIEKVRHLVPKGLELEKYDDLVLLTVLNYNHGNFRPKFLNFIKPIFSSPNQSNWRLYLNSNSLEKQQPTVLFISNIMNNLLYSIGSRIFSNLLQTHYPLNFSHFRKNKEFHTKIESGYSNSPSLDSQSIISDEWTIPNEFNKISSNRSELLEKICIQDFAVSKLSENKLCIAKINLEFDIDDIKPLFLKKIKSKTLEEAIKNTNCFAFVIPDLTFNTINEKILKK